MYVHIVFVVKGRNNLIKEKNRDELEKYICGIIKNKKCKPLALYVNPDHTHILLSLDPTICVSNIVRDIKSNSSKYINDKKWISEIFCWQKGFGAFTYSKSQINNVAKYILNQKEHHKKTTFKEEYISTLKKFNIDYQETYLFEDVAATLL